MLAGSRWAFIICVLPSYNHSDHGHLHNHSLLKIQIDHLLFSPQYSLDNEQQRQQLEERAARVQVNLPSLESTFVCLQPPWWETFGHPISHPLKSTLTFFVPWATRLVRGFWEICHRTAVAPAGKAIPVQYFLIFPIQYFQYSLSSISSFSTPEKSCCGSHFTASHCSIKIVIGNILAAGKYALHPG